MYEFQTTVLPSGFVEHYNNTNAFFVAVYVNNPESRDYSSFNADDKWVGFTQDSLYLSTPNDLAAMQDYTTKVVHTLQEHGATFLSAAENESVADWVNKSRGMITHHFGGSCYTSSDVNDGNRCADAKFRVVGRRMCL